MKLLHVILILTMGFSVLPSCASKSDNSTSQLPLEEGVSVVNNIRLEESDGQSLVAIESADELNYNVFKLNDPERIVIDVIDAQLSPEIPLNLEGAGNISSVSIQPVEDSLSRLVRIELSLNESANYLAGIEGSDLVVRLISPDVAMPQEMMESEIMADESQMFDEVPMLEEPSSEMSELPPLDLPALEEDTQAADEFISEMAPDMPSETIDQFEPLPLPAPIPLPMPSGDLSNEEPMAMNEAQEVPAPAPAPELAPEPLPFPAPLPLQSEEPAIEEAPMLEAEEMPEAAPMLAEEDEDSRVIVEPEAELPPGIATQEIPTTEFTEGTSLLSGLGGKVYTGKRISLEFQDADIQDVVRLIADVSKLNIIIADDVKGKVTLKLVDVPWDQALDILLTSKGLDKVQHGNILRVAPSESLKKEREIALANDKAAKQLEPLRLKLFNVNYAAATEMSDRIKPLLSERGSVDKDSRTNTLIVEDIPEVLSRVENLIKVLDTQTPQVRIESRIVQANDRFTRSLGIQWGPSLKLDEDNGQALGIQFPNTVNVLTAPTGSSAFVGPTPGTLSDFAVDALPGNTVTGGSFGFRLGSINSTFNLDLRLSYAENEQLARVVSRPSVTVLDNQQARIIQGSKIPFLSSSSEGSNVQFQEAGIEISVKPQITNDGSVILEVDTRSNEPGSEQVGGNPIINIREASTNMLVKSGRTAVLGGVFKTSETKGKGGVPGLMNIPVLGWLFKGESGSNVREEMLIFITPYILTDSRSAQLAPSGSSPADPF